MRVFKKKEVVYFVHLKSKTDEAHYIECFESKKDAPKLFDWLKNHRITIDKKTGDSFVIVSFKSFEQ